MLKLVKNMKMTFEIYTCTTYPVST